MMAAFHSIPLFTLPIHQQDIEHETSALQLMDSLLPVNMPTCTTLPASQLQRYILLPVYSHASYGNFAFDKSPICIITKKVDTNNINIQFLGI